MFRIQATILQQLNHIHGKVIDGSPHAPCYLLSVFILWITLFGTKEWHTLLIQHHFQGDIL
jgi:hypothetical protein